MQSTFTDWYNNKMQSTEELKAETARAQKTLGEISSIAIIGLSRGFYKDSQFVGRYLQNAGYQIVPVNPHADEILGEKAYPDLQSIPFPVDVVDVFLPPKIIHKAVDQVLKLHPQPRAIWLQLGTGKHPEEVEKVNQTSIEIYENRCIKADHQFLIRPKNHSTNNK